MGALVEFRQDNSETTGVDPEKEAFYIDTLQSCVETELLRYKAGGYSTFIGLTEANRQAFVRHMDGRRLGDTALHYFTIFAEDVARFELFRLVRSTWHYGQLRIYVTRRGGKLEAWWRAAPE